jgi:type I restriction enzyme S subunit
MTERTLKPGWKMVKFGDVVKLNTDRVANPLASGIERYVGLEHLTPEDLHIHSWGLVAEGTTFTNLFKPGQVLFGKRRAYQRKVAVAEFEGVCSGDIYVFETKDPGVLLQELLPFICQTEGFYKYAVGTSAGSLSPRTNWTQLAEYEFSCPPIDEQQRIAVLLWAATEMIEKYKRVVYSLRRLWVTTTKDHFSKPYGKKECTLGNLLEYASDGPFGSKLKTEHYKRSGVRVIRLQNIQQGAFDATDQAYISEDYFREELSRYRVYPGDVLIAGLGDNSIRAGRACIMPENFGIAINKADCYCLRPKADYLEPGYLVAFLNSPNGLSQSESFAQGTTRYRLNLSNIKRMILYIPDMRIQKKVLDELGSIEQSIRVLDQRIQTSKEMFQVLNHRLFNSVWDTYRCVK